jgi:2-polyprenyl-3-methyl-5-hydroxy-6-metoxy-1,4-benzoquinol methylase
MPKNILLASVRHHLLSACKRFEANPAVGQHPDWKGFVSTLDVSEEDSLVRVAWSRPQSQSVSIPKQHFILYQRGDIAAAPGAGEDPEIVNRRRADEVVEKVLRMLQIEASVSAPDSDLQHREQTFHDQWAASTPPEDVMVRESFEACTAPENRFILEMLGDLKGKKVLDLGCGLGEAAVYFAMQGADVTASDLSPGMLQTAQKVAERYQVKITPHVSPAEKTGLPDSSFDVVYAANVLHHSEIPKVLDEVRRILKPGGTFVSWDPLIHNPAINVYRRLAMGVRTVDEHPLHIGELRGFKDRFQSVNYRCFWLSALLIFVKFYFIDRINPSKERYWKKILSDSKKLEALYTPLEKLDKVLLKLFPWAGRYGWNIVIWCKR